MPDSRNNKKLLKINASSALTLQIVVALVGIIIPKFMIEQYGSAVNGMVASVTQFLGYISLLEAGIGGVIKASLYSPIEEKNSDKISVIINSSDRFFKRIAKIFLMYIAVLAIVYPLFVANEMFSWGYIFGIIAILSVETFIRYYLSLPYQILLQASQRIYVINYLQVILTALNAVSTIVLAYLGYSIHTVKFVTMLIFLARPIFIILYTKKYFHIDKTLGYDDSTISQRWDGFGQHIGFFIHKNTDVAILTMFSSLSEISVYGIYNSIVTAVQTICMSFTNSISATFGCLYAAKENEKLKKVFSQYESFCFIMATVIFSVMNIMMIPFISVYIPDTNDVSYIRPAFSFILILAEYVYVIRSPYSSLVLSAGFFKQTRNGAFIEAGLNIVVSLLLVAKYGLLGVAIGTLVAMSYRTFEFVRFLRKNIPCVDSGKFLRHLIVSIVSVVALYWLGTGYIVPLFNITNFGAWILCAIAVSLFSAGVVAIINVLFNRGSLNEAFRLFF